MHAHCRILLSRSLPRELRPREIADGFALDRLFSSVNFSESSGRFPRDSAITHRSVMSCRTGVVTLLLAAGVGVGAMRAPAGMGVGVGAMRALAGMGPRLSRPAIRRCPLTTITMTDEGE